MKQELTVTAYKKGVVTSNVVTETDVLDTTTVEIETNENYFGAWSSNLAGIPKGITFVARSLPTTSTIDNGHLIGRCYTHYYANASGMGFAADTGIQINGGHPF